MKFSFGSDPEFLLVKDNKYQSAIGIVKSNADRRTKQHGHEFFHDNVMAECAIKPGSSKKEVIENFRECFKLYAKMVKPYKLHIQASHNYDAKQLTNKASRKAACRPEWSVYTRKAILPSDEFAVKGDNGYYFFTTPLRTAGGHVHLGGDSILQNSWQRVFVVYMLDLFLGIPSVFLEKDDTSKNRRKIYGEAGSYREKKYGIEYRTLSNWWLKSPQSVALVWDICEWVLDFCESEGHKKFWHVDDDLLDSDNPVDAYRCYGYDSELLRRAINNSDLAIADKFMKLVGFYMPESITYDIQKLIMADPVDFYESWGI